MYQNLKSIFILGGIFLTILSNGQATLLTSGITVSGGSTQSNMSLDFAIGQIFSQPFTNTDYRGNEGILQVIPIHTTNADQVGLPDILLYPNPTTGMVKISFPQDGLYQVRIFSSTGQLVEYVQTQNMLYELDLNSVIDGIYFVQINRGKESISHRIIKSKF